MPIVVTHGETEECFGKRQLTNDGTYHASKLADTFRGNVVRGVYYVAGNYAAEITAKIIARPHNLLVLSSQVIIGAEDEIFVTAP